MTRLGPARHSPYWLSAHPGGRIMPHDPVPDPWRAHRRLRWLLPDARALCSAQEARTPRAEPLTRVSEVRSFARQKDREAREVDVQGVVTHIDASRGMRTSTMRPAPRPSPSAIQAR